MPLINFSGLASGIDSEALIEATTDVTRTTRVEPHENKISELQDTNDALGELKTKLSEMKALVDGFSTLNGGVIAKEGVSSDETVVTATASNSANNGSYNLTVTQVAKNGTLSLAGSTAYPSGATAMSPTTGGGDVVIDIGTGPEETITIPVTNTTTLDQFVSAFNTAAGEATAALVNIGTDSSPQYVVLINTLNEGLEKGTITITGTPDAAWDAEAVPTTSQATNALFSIDGISGTITRSSNTVNDLLQGVTFKIEDTGSATFSVNTDVATTSSNIEDYVNAYNDIVEFLNENNLIEREESGKDVENIFGALAKTSVDNNALSSLKSVMSASVSASGNSIKIFPDLGISTERDGTLKLDMDTLESAINSEPHSVRELLEDFGDTAGNTGGTIDQYIRFNGLLDTTINSNQERISTLNDDIARAEDFIAKQEAQMRARFARLESMMSQMQAQQQNLVSILGGINQQ